ncbi:hypothetical protein [Halobacterium litoreum]|uniref:Uncharacterized protein n=1 Tax=Halobacterium litoreum TaxID=2039234 RepID=A0ABD5NAC4_9EURY|nr:hypothetical protein [Halobacterium litoreum]UHH14817.1 hypothetical protein LT972_07380 [Halobacterium litoreum]
MPLGEILSVLGVGSLLGTIGGYEYRRRREESRERANALETWFDESLGLIGRGVHAIQTAQHRSDPDYEGILDDLAVYSEGLHVKAKNPPDGVSDSAVSHVQRVSTVYAKASKVAEVEGEKQGVELLQELFEMAQKEPQERVDFEEAITQAAGESPAFGNLIGAVEQNISGGRGEFAEEVEEIITEWDSSEFKQLMLGAANRGGGVESITEQAMDLFFTIAQDVSVNSMDMLKSEKRSR